MLTGPLKFTPVERPEGKRYFIEGRVALDFLYLTESVLSGNWTVFHAAKALGDAVSVADAAGGEGSVRRFHKPMLPVGTSSDIDK